MKNKILYSKKCQYEMNMNKPCGKFIDEDVDNEFCIFHSKNIKAKIAKFSKAFNAEFTEQEKSIEFDFSGFIFPPGFNFSGMIFKKNVSFRNAIFLKEIEFDRSQFLGNTTDFSDSIFIGFICFDRVTFSGENVDFSRAVFCGSSIYSIVFAGCTFECYADFNCVYFFDVDIEEKKSSKENTDEFIKNFITINSFLFEFAILGPISYSYLKDNSRSCYPNYFYPGLRFNGTVFKKGVSFYETKIRIKNIDFSRSIFNKRANFDHTEFYSDKISFHHSHFYESAYFDMARFNCDELDLSSAKFFSENNCLDFIKERIDKINLFDSYFNNISDFFFEQFEYKTKFFKLTKSKIKDFRFRLGENAAEKYPILNRETKDAWFLAEFSRKYPRIFKIWKLSCNCGKSLFRWSLWSLMLMIFFAIIFSIIFQFFPQTFSSEVISSDYPLISFFYFSAVTFTTLGFGDIVPKNVLVQILVTFEVIIGYIMLGGLISIFSNKLARRS